MTSAAASFQPFEASGGRRKRRRAFSGPPEDATERRTKSIAGFQPETLFLLTTSYLAACSQFRPRNSRLQRFARMFDCIRFQPIHNIEKAAILFGAERLPHLPKRADKVSARSGFIRSGRLVLMVRSQTPNIGPNIPLNVRAELAVAQARSLRSNQSQNDKTIWITRHCHCEQYHLRSDRLW